MMVYLEDWRRTAQQMINGKDEELRTYVARDGQVIPREATNVAWHWTGRPSTIGQPASID